MMMLASGANFGLRASLPHWFGIITGTFFVFVSVGFGLTALLALYPQAGLILKVAGLLYLLYLAYRIATASGFSERQAGKPLTFLEAVLIQALNVKLIGVAAGVFLNYPLIESAAANTLLVASAAALVNGPCVGTWCLFGAQLKRFLMGPRARLTFNLFLALLIVVSLMPSVVSIVSDLQS